MNGITVLNGEIGYKDIPKTACTAIKEELYRIHFDKPFEDDGDIEDPNNKYAIHTHLRDETSMLGSIDDCKFKFIVVRDPVKRFLSAYSNRVVDHEELAEGYLNQRPKDKHLMRYLPTLSPTLNEFIDDLLVYTKVGVIDHHVSPLTVKLSGKKLNYFDKVYKMEDLSKLEKDLSKKLKTSFQLQRRHEGRKKSSLQHLNYSRLKFLINYYKEDYKLLDGLYSPEDLWQEWLAVSGLKNRLEFKFRKALHKLRTFKPHQLLARAN
ncbi:sulfotransferase family 2 domain-containing protein [Candidatus Saccharibacteria bacterium]|nr:sulfotransferase family 2 domain-containing protein [Candidatus Saccharibacteria bacterium]